MDALSFLEQELQNLKDQGLYREPRTSRETKSHDQSMTVKR